jgi:hypothetical protein
MPRHLPLFDQMAACGRHVAVAQPGFANTDMDDGRMLHFELNPSGELARQGILPIFNARGVACQENGPRFAWGSGSDRTDPCEVPELSVGAVSLTPSGSSGRATTRIARPSASRTPPSGARSWCRASRTPPEAQIGRPKQSARRHMRPSGAFAVWARGRSPGPRSRQLSSLTAASASEDSSSR